MRILVVCLMAAIFILPFSAQAGSSIDIATDDPVYRHLALLRSYDLIKTDIVGHKPYSRDEVIRLIREARKNWEVKKEEVSENGDALLDYLEKKYDPEGARKKFLDPHPLEEGDLLLTFLKAEPKQFPNNGLGLLPASSTPLVWNRQGRDYPNGFEMALESIHWLGVTHHATFLFHPRLQFQFPRNNGDASAKAFVQELYGVFNVWNVELQGGRSTLALGQGPHGGLLLSDHARPVDHVHLTNDHPFLFPWVFENLGRNKITVFFSTLGPESFFPNTYYAGYKWTIKPWRLWEIGLANVLTIGGDGAPDFSPEEFLGDFIGFSATGNGKSNRILGIDTRLRLPFLAHAELYGEAFWDDKTIQNFKRTLIDSVAYYGGIVIPRLDWNGTFSGRVEFRYLSELMYRHSQFQSGYSLNGEILGDPQGPDSHGFLAELGWEPNFQTFFSARFAYEVADSDTYMSTGDEILTTVDNSAEKRIRGLLHADHRFSKKIRARGNVGYERVINFNYGQGDNRNDFIVEGGVTLNF